MKLVWILGGLALAISPVFAQQDTKDVVQKEADSSVVSVTTIAISEVLVQPVMRVSAEAVSLNHAQISAQATGEVLAIEHDVGAQVEKGAVLISLDCRQSELEQAMAQDSRNLAGKEYKRSQSLGKTLSIAEQQLNQAQSALAQARIREKQSAIAVENCLIKAPFSGVITLRQIQLGAVASPGVPVLELLQTDAVEVEAYVNTAELQGLQSAENINFVTENTHYPIKLRSVLPLVNNASNKRIVRLEFIDQPSFVGSSGDIVWSPSTRVLPVEFIVQRKNQLGYFVVEGETAKFVPLVHATMGHPAILDLNGQDGHQISLIAEGRYRVEQGSSIKVLN